MCKYWYLFRIKISIHRSLATPDHGLQIPVLPLVSLFQSTGVLRLLTIANDDTHGYDQISIHRSLATPDKISQYKVEESSEFQSTGVLRLLTIVLYLVQMA